MLKCPLLYHNDGNRESLFVNKYSAIFNINDIIVDSA